MKSVALLLNGLTDLPQKKLNGFTPLEAATTQALDYLAQHGEVLSLSTPKAIENSLSHFFTINNYSNLHEAYLKAKYYDLDVEGKTLFCFQFVSLSGGIIVEANSSLLSDQESKALVSDLNKYFEDKGIQFYFFENGEGLTLINQELEVENNSLLLHQTLGQKLERFIPIKSFQPVLKLIVDFLQNHEINQLKSDLEEPQANGILLYNGGSVSSKNNETLTEKGLVISTETSSLGLAKIIGFDTYLLSGTNHTYENLSSITNLISKKIADYDIVVLDSHHLWKSTLNGNLLEKIKGLEAIDKQLLDPLIDICKKHESQLAILPLKHSSIESRSFLQGPVPSVIYTPKRARKKPSQYFSEKICSQKESLPLDQFMNEYLFRIVT